MTVAGRSVPGAGLGSCAFLALAYRRTGDPKFLKEIEESLRSIRFTTERIGGDGILDEPSHTRIPGLPRPNKYVCHLGNTLNLAPYGMAVLKR